jgi:hypothetical protein
MQRSHTFCIRLLQLLAYPPQNMSTTQSCQTQTMSCPTHWYHVPNHIPSCLQIYVRLTNIRHTCEYMSSCLPHTSCLTLTIVCLRRQASRFAYPPPVSYLTPTLSCLRRQASAFVGLCCMRFPSS